MLRVPELKPGEEPFDPDRARSAHPMIKPADHLLPVMRAGGPHQDGNAIRSPEPAPAENDPRLQAIRRRNALSDDAGVRSALTDLHERGEEFERTLVDLPARQAQDIGKLTDAFLAEQRRERLGELTGESQKRRFERGFDVFGQETRARSERLREEKTHAWQKEVGERQNRIFLDRALRPENLFDDQAQTRLRDMYLLNVDNLNDGLPENERKAAVDAAAAQFCGRVLDRRLEADPAAMRALLDAPAVRRVLGEEALAGYEKRAAAAVRDDGLRLLSRTWFDAGLEPAGARERALRECPDAGEREVALGEYGRLRERAHREAAVKNLLDVDKAWREAAAAGSGDNPSLDALRRADPELAGRLEQVLDRRRRGGPAAKPDYALLLRLTDDFDPRRAAEELADRGRLAEVYTALGGADAPEFSAYLRAFLGKATPGDESMLESLRLARGLAASARGDDIPDADLSLFLHRYAENSRIFMERRDYKELDHSEKVMLARKSLEDMGWNGKEALDNADADADNGDAAGTVRSAGDMPLGKENAGP